MSVNEHSNAATRKSGLWISAAYLSAIGALAFTGLDTEDAVNAVGSISFDGNMDLGTMFASAITLFGIFIAYRSVVGQIKQEDIKIRSENIEKHVIGAANNVLAYNVPEGYFVEYNEANMYVAAWRYDAHKDIKRNVVSVHFNLLVQPFFEIEKEGEVIDSLCNREDSDRWGYRIMVSRIKGDYGSVLEIGASGGLAKMSNHFYKCVILSMKRLQLSNYNMLMEYRANLADTPLKEANDALLEENVFDRPTESVD